MTRTGARPATKPEATGENFSAVGEHAPGNARGCLAARFHPPVSIGEFHRGNARNRYICRLHRDSNCARKARCLHLWRAPDRLPAISCFIPPPSTLTAPHTLSVNAHQGNDATNHDRRKAAHPFTEFMKKKFFINTENSTRFQGCTHPKRSLPYGFAWATPD